MSTLLLWKPLILVLFKAFQCSLLKRQKLLEHRQYMCIGFKKVFLPKAMASVSVKHTRGYIPIFFLSSPTLHLYITLSASAFNKEKTALPK